MAISSAPSETRGPPYPPPDQGLGGNPTIIPDVPICSVFLGLFTFAAIAHIGLFQFNMRKRKRKFAFNAATFGFCFTRILATSLRIAWACFPQNVSLGLSAQILVYAGIPILFFCNLFWAQRIVRAQHPALGWNRACSIWLPVLMVIAVLTILALISAIVVQFYVPDAHTQDWTRAVQLYGATYFGVMAILPIPIELLSSLIKTYPTFKDRSIDNFGSGSLSSKILISLISALFLSLGAWYRAITSYLDPLPRTAPSPWYFSQPAFYTVNFALEISVVLAWFLLRVDRRFIVPDGARGPYSYANGFVFAGEPGNEKHTLNPAAAAAASHQKSSTFLAASSGPGPGLTPRSSTATLPPPRLARAASWGELVRYLSDAETHVSWDGTTTKGDEDGAGPESGSRGERVVLEDGNLPHCEDGAESAMVFDPRTGCWTVRRLSVYGDRAEVRPGSSVVSVSASSGLGRREGL